METINGSDIRLHFREYARGYNLHAIKLQIGNEFRPISLDAAFSLHNQLKAALKGKINRFPRCIACLERCYCDDLRNGLCRECRCDLCGQASTSDICASCYTHVGPRQATREFVPGFDGKILDCTPVNGKEVA